MCKEKQLFHRKLSMYSYIPLTMFCLTLNFRKGQKKVTGTDLPNYNPSAPPLPCASTVILGNDIILNKMEVFHIIFIIESRTAGLCLEQI